MVMRPQSAAGEPAAERAGQAPGRPLLPAWATRALDWATLALVLCLALELTTRIALSRPELLDHIDRTSDAAWRLDWLRRQSAGPAIFYSFDDYHPTRGWALRPNLRDADPYGPSSLSSNSAGMRGRQEFSLVPPTDRTRVLLIGDSFTFGEEVPDQETFGHDLQRLLPRAEVLNLGVHGYGHDQMLVTLREVGLRYRPDVVIVGFVRDDMQRNMLGFRDYAKPRFELEDGSLVLQGSPVPSPAETVARERHRLRFLDLLEMVRETLLWRTGINQRRMEALTAALLDEIARASSSAGADTVFVYLPHSEELTDPELTLDAQLFFTDFCEDRRARCLDLRPSFLETIAGGTPIKAPGHWHAAGHSVVAEELAAFLDDQGLVS